MASMLFFADRHLITFYKTQLNFKYVKMEKQCSKMVINEGEEALPPAGILSVGAHRYDNTTWGMGGNSANIAKDLLMHRDVNSREINFPGGISQAGNKFPGTRSGPERPSINTFGLSWFPVK